MDASHFIAKWRNVVLTERSASQQHFCDLCELFGHPKPADVDKTGESFTFERGAAKQSGGEGWADVWKKGYFGWEYKGKHKDLAAAFQQLLDYHDDLENPPLLVVCDMDLIEIHTNFTNTRSKVYTIPLLQMDKPENLEILRNVFWHYEKLKPESTRDDVTKEAAERIGEIALKMRDRQLDAHEVAQFLDRIVFCLFAEDIDLLPARVFGRLVEASQGQPEVFQRKVAQLFDAMAKGGDFGPDTIRRFNGNLFEDSPALLMTDDELDRVYHAAKLDWGSVDPTIFGTLFERGMDPDKRAHIGAHYTSRQDIETLVEPVVMAPLDREWEAIQKTIENLLATGRKDGTAPKNPLSQAQIGKARDEAESLVRRFHDNLTQVKVLDPACGSGNFLYVTLQKLMDLEQAIVLYALNKAGWPLERRVGPWQLYGIEINEYAYDLAQMVVWIGYIQWVRANGFPIEGDPVLRPMSANFQKKDAILDLSDPAHPKEAEWPRVDYIVGNPPFLGSRFMWESLGVDYAQALESVYSDRLGGKPDLCCYWFEKALGHLIAGGCQRAGLLATQGIRGGTNRNVLQRIKATGSIFFAESDRAWVLDGANVHVSMVAFDLGEEERVMLDGRPTASISASLTTGADVSLAQPLAEGAGLAFQGCVKRGSFDIPDQEALRLLTQEAGNPNGRPNSDVLLPYLNASDVTKRGRNYWIIDFSSGPSIEEACRYAEPFTYVEAKVRPERAAARQHEATEQWWLHWRARPNLESAVGELARIAVTPRVAKHRVFAWIDTINYVDNALVAFARSDDYFFGVLHSRLHEVWALRLGTRLETRPRYTPTTCFETFPFPWPPGKEPAEDPLVQAVAAAARELNRLRENWLNPTEWTKTEVLEFPGSVDGPWARYVHDPGPDGVGTVRYPRIVDNGVMPSQLKRRTLTNLYNEMPTWLRNAHAKLNEAVCAAYAATTGDSAWRPDMSDEEILEKLLALNLARA